MLQRFQRYLHLSAKRTLIATLTLQMMAPHAYAQSRPGSDTESPSEEVQNFLTDLENGALSKQSNRQFDIFNLIDQKIEIYQGSKTQVYDLNQMQVDIPTVAFTDMRVGYDSSRKMIVIEALRGMGASADSGVVVARQFIKNLDVVAYSQDAEMIQLVDREGKVHAIDMGFLKTNAFKNALPVFKNLWQGDLGQKEIRVGFITRGSSGLTITENSLVPKNEKGEVILTAGDFYIADKKSGEVKAILSREVTYQSMIRGFKVLTYQSALLTPDIEIQMKAEKAIEGLDGRLDKIEQAVQLDKESPTLTQILTALDEKTRKSMLERSEHVGGLSTRDRDQFTQAEWMKTLTELQSQNRDGQSLSPEEMEKDWHQFLTKYQPKNTQFAPEESKSVLSKLRKKFSAKNSLKIMTGILATSSVLYLGYPYVHDFYFAQEQFKVMNWAYEHFYPAVLKDATYRTPLLLSMASLAALWPEAVAVSALIGKTLRNMAEKMKNDTSKRAIYIRDLAKNWGPLSTWQRITSFGMRLYAWLILPYWRVTIEHLFRQKSYFAAVNNGLNPFQKVLADSELGQKLGLTKDQRLGLNSLFGKSYDQDLATNQKVQSAMVSQNRKVDGMAILIASTLLAEKYKMDPATVTQVMEQEGHADKSWLNGPGREKEWLLLTDLLMREMKDLKKGQIVIDNHMSELIEKYYQSGKEILQKLDQSSETQKRLLDFRRRFNRKAHSTLVSAANLGKEDHEFLKKVFTNEFVSNQVKQEFTVDHMMVVSIVALYGERADLSHPDHLAADPHGLLWTSKAHWYDIFLNTFAHFFIAGSSIALVFQKVKPKDAKNYGPVEHYIYESKERVQSLGSATAAWVKDVSVPWKADLGGIIIKRFFRRFTTMTAGLTLMMLLRVGIWGQPVTHATAAWFFNFIAAQWFFGWVWDPVQRGNQMEGERFSQMEEELKKARLNLMKGDEKLGRTEIETLYRKYNPQVLKEYNLNDLSKEEILDLTILRTPIYTKTNPLLSWITTWGGAVGSTILAIPLSVILMDARLLMDPALYSSWMIKSALLYTGAYLLLGKKPWEYYFKTWDKVISRFEEKKSKVLDKMMPWRNKSAAGLKCVDLFR